ncbi:unnamed protein product [Mycena citricolor]|uniref:Uncharacterized protein n=1 Tax=Mycena citricolor TaxID=2018698 RepID=A0AAD2K4N5_9AGAR|nr:unnamed protein product [Mycena citricolor]
MMPPTTPGEPNNRRRLSEPFMHGIYCWRYREKNREYLQRKTREAMSRLYYGVGVDPAVHEERLERRKQAAAKYREQNRRKLKLKARERRQIAREGSATAV